MTIASRANNTLPFLFVSDGYTAGEVTQDITRECADVIVSDPIPFNSTGNVRRGSVVQYYRGESAAILLQGYENAKGMPGNPNLAPNPPFPPTVNMSMWVLLNSTVGESIPLLNPAPGFPSWAITVCVLFPIISLLGCCWFFRGIMRKR